jgi:hypothetical protein
LKEQYLAVDSPTLVRLAFFDPDEQVDTARVLEAIKKGHWPEPPVVSEKSARIKLKELLCSVELSKEKYYDIFSIETRHIRDDYVTTEWQRDLDNYRIQVQPVIDRLPKNPIWVISVFIGSISGENDALRLIREYAENADGDKVSAGIIGDCLLTMFRKTYGEVGSQFLPHHLLLCPINLARHQAKQAVSKLIADIKDLAINIVKLNRLYQSCQPYFHYVIY